MDEKTVVLLGATGLIGGHLLQLMLNDSSIDKVRILSRRPLDVKHPKIDLRLIDFENKSLIRDNLGTGSAIFCCVGTTQKKVARDKNAYRKVDLDIPVDTGRIGRENGFNQYLFISSVGANDHARNFYLQLKGRVEKELATFAYPSLHLFRPSILVGRRKESRPLETVGKFFMKLFSFVLVGSRSKYRPVHARTVAQAMLNAYKRGTPGETVYSYPEIKAMAG